MDDWKNELLMSLINNENDGEILSKKHEKFQIYYIDIKVLDQIKIVQVNLKMIIYIY